MKPNENGVTLPVSVETEKVKSINLYEEKSSINLEVEHSDANVGRDTIPVNNENVLDHLSNVTLRNKRIKVPDSVSVFVHIYFCLQFNIVFLFYLRRIPFTTIRCVPGPVKIRRI